MLLTNEHLKRIGYDLWRIDDEHGNCIWYLIGKYGDQLISLDSQYKTMNIGRIEGLCIATTGQCSFY